MQINNAYFHLIGLYVRTVIKHAELKEMTIDLQLSDYQPRDWEHSSKPGLITFYVKRKLNLEKCTLELFSVATKL